MQAVDLAGYWGSRDHPAVSGLHLSSPGAGGEGGDEGDDGHKRTEEDHKAANPSLPKQGFKTKERTSLRARPLPPSSRKNKKESKKKNTIGGSAAGVPRARSRLIFPSAPIPPPTHPVRPSLLFSSSKNRKTSLLFSSSKNRKMVLFLPPIPPHPGLLFFQRCNVKKGVLMQVLKDKDDYPR